MRERLFDTVGSVIFLLLYLLGPAIFGARIQAADDGLRVEQYYRIVITYSEIQICYSFYLFPWQLVILTTKRSFPLNILIEEDRLTGRRKSIMQDGELATRVKSKMGASG